jgi:carbon-monoxide dehydrogenase small subunit
MATTDPPEPSAHVDVQVELNDESLTRSVTADMPLSRFLRREEFLTGTHRGCESGKCGACTVLVDGEPVKSCNVLAAQANGSTVRTVEGLVGDDGELHPVQEAFWDTHGMQCGFCTPGMVVNSVALLEENEDPSVGEIREQLSGNICRCTGYTKIIESVKNAAAESEGGE